MSRARGSRSQIALAFEDTYGIAPSAGEFWRIPFARSSLGSEQPLLENDLLGYGRDPLDPVKDVITVDGDMNVPIDARYLGIWFKALMGEPTTTGSADPYTHVFKSGEYDLPSLSIETGLPDVPSYALIEGVKVNSINWTMQRSGLVTATVACMGKKETNNGSTVAGALTDLDITRFGAFNGTIKKDDANIGQIVSGQVTYSNNLEAIENLSEDGLVEGHDEGEASLSGELTVRFADNSFLTQATDGTPCKLEFVYNLSPTRSFKLVAHRVYVPRPRRTIDGPTGIQMTVNWQASLDPTEGVLCTATLVNDQPDYDNP